MTMNVFRASANARPLGPSPASSLNVVIRFDGQYVLLGRIEESTSNGDIDTVTVVVYPSNVISTLPQSHGPTLTDVNSGSVSLPQSFGATPSAALQVPSPSSAPPSESSQATSTTAADSDSGVPPSSTGPSSFGPRQSHPPSVTLPGDPTKSEGASYGPTSRSKLASLDPPLYAGIALGGIAAFAIIAALVAWCIRSWHNRRRRKAAATLPWVQQRGNDFGGLEAGSNSAAGWSADSRLMGADHSLPSTRQWISTDRDVGEPRRSDSYEDTHGYPLEHYQHTPIHQFLSDRVGRETIDDNYPLHTRKPTLRRQLPSHLVNEDLSDETLTLGPDRVGGEYEVGTPREDAVVPRYLSLKGPGLEMPWTIDNCNNHEPFPPPRSIAERLRRASKSAQENFEYPLSSDTPGRPAPEGWAGSITTNLVNAFNAVAANIGTFHPGDGETVTSKPSNRGTGRKGTLDSSSDVPVGRTGPLDGYGSPSKLSTESSVPWTLEEIADGTGIVHLNISPSKERPPYPHSSRMPSSLYSSRSSSTIPLVASHEPQAVRLKPEISHHFRIQLDQALSVSRQTSYSQQSFVSSGNNTPPSTSPLKISARRKNSSERGQKDKLSPASHRHPSLLSRLSSTSSATSWNSLSSPTANRQVSEFLRARKRTHSRG